MKTSFLILAVETKRTFLNFGCHHFYTTRKCIVDKDHIDSFSLLTSREGRAPTHFNKVFTDTNFYDIDIVKLAEQKAHFD